jgi:hypothetical protein
MPEPGADWPRTSRLTRHCAWAALACAANAAAAPPAPYATSLDIAMQKHQHYFSERCITALAGARLAFAVESPYPVDFNVHHHMPSATEYPVKQRLEGRYQSTIVLPGGGEYCFMWENPESRATDFTIRLHYTATAG